MIDAERNPRLDNAVHLNEDDDVDDIDDKQHGNDAQADNSRRRSGDAFESDTRDNDRTRSRNDNEQDTRSSREANRTNLYVNGLSQHVRKADIVTLFQKYGKVVRIEIISEPYETRPRGFGFVEMDTPAQAQEAIDGVNNTEFMGRRLTVDLAKRTRPRTPTPGSYRGMTLRRTTGTRSRSPGRSHSRPHSRHDDDRYESTRRHRDTEHRIDRYGDERRSRSGSPGHRRSSDYRNPRSSPPQYNSRSSNPPGRVPVEYERSETRSRGGRSGRYEPY